MWEGKKSQGDYHSPMPTIFCFRVYGDNNLFSFGTKFVVNLIRLFHHDTDETFDVEIVIKL